MNISILNKKYAGKRVGFTCSCFDLVHPGHIKMLQDTREQCDILIVGLQTDPTLDRPEKNKPVQTLKERGIMLRAIKYIDEVIEYSYESELHKILCTLRIDVRVLGTDWKGNPYTGSDLPIPIYWHQRNHNWSTTELRQRILNMH
uniref:Cytidylyltransferase-like protein n=1 Tax=Marseillevirus LCMAC201 TaxID=2506605 RepID=A0A481YX37_9VIRU|nr:MAG: cytidylyltransferase-like protein [Marseillevirus LCMAC201]